MADKIDVLAVMERAARELWVTGEPVNPVAVDLISARAAISDLIEAAQMARELFTWNSIGGPVVRSLDSALSRVSGA